MSASRTLLALALGLTCSLRGAHAQQTAAPAPAPQPLPVFPGGVEQVVVDVVVLDGQGRAVTGLTQDDFTLSEEGAARPVLSFEAVAPADDAATAAAAEGGAGRAPLTRVFALVFDDLHLTVAGGGRVKDGLKEMVGGVLRDSDEVALLTTSSGQVWSGRVGTQRSELLAAIDRQHGLLPPPRSCEMTDEEATQIHVERDRGVQQLVFERLVKCGLLTRQASPLIDQVLPNPAAQAQGAPQAPPTDVPGLSMLESWAVDQHQDAARRVRGTYGSLERLLRALGPVRGRKTVVLGSEGFVRDRGTTAIQGVVNAASDTNAAVYFLDARTLTPRVLTPSGDARHAAGSSELGRLQQGRFFGAEASEQLAVETGGAAIRGGDLAGGLRRLAEESRTYYLLGYTPADPALDGRFRNIAVKVRHPGLTVRARRGYYSLARSGPAPANVAVTTAAAVPPAAPAPAAPVPVAPNPEAVAVYLRPPSEARAAVARWSPPELQRAVEALKAGSASDDVLEAAALAHAGAALGPQPSAAQARAAVQAAGLLDDAPRRRGLEARLYLGLAHGFLEAHDWVTAQDLAEQACARLDANAEALLALGIVQETTGSVANGGHRPNPDQTLLTAGFDEMMSRNPVSGFAAGVPGGPRQPSFAPRMTRKGAEATAETRLRRAAESYRKALRVRPELTEARLRLGRTLALLGEGKAAAQELGQVAAGPGEPEMAYLAHLFLGDLREQQEEFAEAARAYQAAQAARPSSAVARLALARAQHAKGDRGAATSAVQALLLDARPPDRDPWWSYRLRPLGRFASGLGSSGGQ
jgi:VWFA-related protein